MDSLTTPTPALPTRGREKERGSAAPAVARAGLIATAQPITFEPGLYCIEISAPTGPVTELGVMLPCLRIEFLPATPARQGRGTWMRKTEDGWLCGKDPPAFVMVAGGAVGALMTSYCSDDGSPGPVLRINKVPASLAPAGQVEPHATEGQSGAIPLAMYAHIAGVGDLTAGVDGWLGAKGKPLEGFSLMPAAPFDPADIEYQAILGRDWSTPWVPGGAFCGIRGLQLPIFGFRVRLGEARSDYECVYSGRFADGTSLGPYSNGEPCHVAETPLEAMHVVIRRRGHTGQR